ncbi:MAG: hypothetical protein QOJ26_329 [Thermoplasmata archaeon]|nr:hypothetical protein [Thermoplasmata archaeon]
MAPKFVLMSVALLAMTLAGCTSGSDGNGDGSSTSTSGGVGVGGTVSGPGGGVGGNATVSGSATGTSTNSTSPDGNMTADVDIAGSKFTPSTVTILVGGTVTWTHNDGTTAHTVTADGGSFDSSPTCAGPLPIQADCLTQGEHYTVTFAEAGDFAYHCKIHSSMTGTVRVVQP